MSHSKIIQLAQRVTSYDIAWFTHRARVALGLRGPVPRPQPLTSQIGTSASLSGLGTEHNGPIKVIVFSHNLEHEGASISLNELVIELFQRGVISPQIVAFADGPLRAAYESRGISIQIVPGMLHRVSTVKRLETEIDRLRLLIRGAGGQLVLVNTLLSFLAVLAAERASVPSVWIIRESEPWDRYFCFLPDPVAKQAIAAIGLPRKVVFAAHATRKVWETFDTRQSFKVIHNGVNLNRFPLRGDVAERVRSREAFALNMDSVAILCVGTLCDRKNQLDLIDAFTLLPEAIARHVQILLVGDGRGNYADTLKKKCKSLAANFRDQIRIFPPTESISSFYAAADLLVLSSKVESFPRVVLEAMAFGLPIITTPVFGVLEQVVEGENALFYRPGDSPMLARHIEYVVSDVEGRFKMAEHSRQRISQMTTFDEMVAAYATVSREAVC